MKSNLIALKTQETEQDFTLLIEPKITQKLAQFGVEITKTITFNFAEDMQKSLFYLLEPCSIVFVDFSNPSFDEILNEIKKFYAVSEKDFELGKYWHDETNNRFCLLFNLNDLSFINKIDCKFLKSLFAPTKYLKIIKTYGINAIEIKKAMLSISNPEKFEYFITSNFLDCELNILVEGDYYDTDSLNNYLRSIYQILNNYIYSDTDCSLYDQLDELLELRNIKLSFCDFLTDGKFQYLLKKNLKNYSKSIAEFMEIFDKKELSNKLLMKEETFERIKDSCEEMIYESAVAMLDKKISDIAVVLYNDQEKYYVGIGDNEAIHLYKFSFDQNPDFIKNVIIQTTIFKLLKKIKKNTGLF